MIFVGSGGSITGFEKDLIESGFTERELYYLPAEQFSEERRAFLNLARSIWCTQVVADIVLGILKDKASADV